MDREFSEDEAREVFARAAERQHAVEARGEGLSLAELQEIGREVGLDPEHVAAAVAELRTDAPAEPVVVAGVDMTPRRVRVLPGELTDEVWEQMVARLRRTFGSKGIASQVGRLREWTSGPGSNLHVVAELVEGGTRVTIETSKAHEVGGPMGLRSGLVVFAAFAVGLSLLFALGDFGPMAWIIPVLMLVLGAGTYAGARAYFARWSGRRTDQFDWLLDQFELFMRTAGRGATGAAEVAGPRLDLDGLAEPEPERGESESQRRTRS